MDEIKMNVYDFDNTIYYGDSTMDFYLYCLKKHPQIIKELPRQIVGYIKYKVKKIDKTTFKSEFFSFMKDINDYQKNVNDFWNIYSDKIFDWYKEKQHKDDLIISASPAFLLRELCNRIGIRNLIASEVDPYTGQFTSPNCYGKEKVIRYKRQYGELKIEEFYSDSYSDSPMAELSRNAYIVKKNKILEWGK